MGSSSGGGGGGEGGGRGAIASTGINEQSDTETLDNSESEINPNIKQRRQTINNDAVIVKDTSPNDGEIQDEINITNGTKNNTSFTNEQQNN